MVYIAKTPYCLYSIHGVQHQNTLSFMLNPWCTELKHPVIYVQSMVYRAKTPYHLCSIHGWCTELKHCIVYVKSIVYRAKTPYHLR